MPRIELVTIGNELLGGRTVNRHACTLGRALVEQGLSLTRDTTIPDDVEGIGEGVQAALERADVVVVSGGLGPTPDDITRDAIARMLGREVVQDPPSLDMARKKFQRSGKTLSKEGERQTQIVEGAVALSNPVGAAPGQRLDLEQGTVFILPGPPPEFKAILEKHLMPWLTQQALDIEPRLEQVFMISGTGESTILSWFSEAGLPSSGIEVAFYPSPARVELVLTAPGHAHEELNADAERVRSILDAYIVAETRTNLETVLGTLLTEQQATVSVAESCTGGYLGHRLTGVPGSSGYFMGGIIAYDNAVKKALLGVDATVLEQEGAVSEPVACQMARGVRDRLGTDYGVGITGIAGPGGGTTEKPVGLVYIALADAGETWCRRFVFPGERNWIKEASSQMALDLLWRRLTGKKEG